MTALGFGEIGELVREDIRLVSAPRDNVEMDAETEFLLRR